MVNYEKIFEPYYEGGWEAYPLETTLITAGALNAYDAALMHIEDYLANQIDPNDNLAETYDDTATYEVGDYCVYNGVLYKCVTAIDEAEEFDLEKWDHVLVTDEMGSGGGGGTTVIANPVGEPTDDLETIQIGETIYDIPGGGGNANIWTGTQAEYEQQASQIPDDTVVLITDDEEHTQAFDIYSTDEQVIGTWVNGETLYRKTINFGALPNATDKSVAHEISNLGYVCKADAVGHNTTSGLRIPFPMTNSGYLNQQVSWWITDTSIVFRTAVDYSSTNVCYVTLEYTKTV